MIIENLGNGTLVNANNLEAMKTYEDNTFDSCISDFPYDLAFMGRNWDSYENFYEWCKERAEGLYRIIKHGGYVLIFGHHKTNHRMKCAFEDVGFKIVEEIDWVYGSGFPKNQDIGKMFDKEAKAERVGTGRFKERHGGGKHSDKISQLNPNWKKTEITLPCTDEAKEWHGWKTAGLKPAKEIITVFQKPMIGKYTNNIKQFGCGAMNIDDCRIEYKNKADLDITKAKCNFTENSKSIGFGAKDSIYGTGETPLEQARLCLKDEGRFPSNFIIDNYISKKINEQSCDASNKKEDMGASRFYLNVNEEFFPFMYCNKPTKKEKGEYCSHITVKPKKLIKWLIKLVTPKNGLTLDITAGSGTHGLSCEELNREEGYNLKWVDIELLNTEKEPYFDIAKKRIEDYILKSKTL